MHVSCFWRSYCGIFLSVSCFAENKVLLFRTMCRCVVIVQILVLTFKDTSPYILWIDYFHFVISEEAFCICLIPQHIAAHDHRPCLLCLLCLFNKENTIFFFSLITIKKIHDILKRVIQLLYTFISNVTWYVI